MSLSSNGNTLAIVADYNDGNGRNSGHVRVYSHIETSWVQLGGDIDGESALNLSGVSVSLSDDGKTAAIGTQGNGRNGRNSGQVRV